MKKLLFTLLLSCFLISCEEEGELTKTSSGNSINSSAVLRYSGTFNPTSGINVNGDAKIYLEGTNYKLKLENFTITDGPDLKVYLSKAETPNDFINVGNLIPTSNLTYAIPNQVNFEEYKYVLIHCQQYNHLFATAMLNTN